MKSARYIALISVSAFAFSLGAFAKNENSGSFDLGETTRVGSTELAPGHYKAEWNGPADNLKVNIRLNGKEVATAEGHLKDLGKQAQQNETLTKQGNGTRTLEEVQFHHRNEALDFSE